MVNNILTASATAETAKDRISPGKSSRTSWDGASWIVLSPPMTVDQECKTKCTDHCGKNLKYVFHMEAHDGTHHNLGGCCAIRNGFPPTMEALMPFAWRFGHYGWDGKHCKAKWKPTTPESTTSFSRSFPLRGNVTVSQLTNGSWTFNVSRRGKVLAQAAESWSTPQQAGEKAYWICLEVEPSKSPVRKPRPPRPFLSEEDAAF